MNKENKNNETFSDIFSSIEKKDLDSKETISFNSITKSSDKKLNFSDLTKTIDESKSNKDSKSIFKIAQEKEKLSNPSTTITNSINNINDLLDSENGALIKIYESRRLLDYLRDEEYDEYSTKLNDCYYALQDVNDSLKSSLESLNEYEYSPDTLSS